MKKIAGAEPEHIVIVIPVAVEPIDVEVATVDVLDDVANDSAAAVCTAYHLFHCQVEILRENDLRAVLTVGYINPPICCTKYLHVGVSQLRASAEHVCSYSGILMHSEFNRL